MGLKLETGKRSKKFAVIFVRTCYRSVCNHPFLVGVLFCLIILYRSFPFCFSLLVSASPVLVCTAILLGTLLSFGQPNIPEIGKEEYRSHDIASLRAGVSENDTVLVERDENFVIGRYEGKKSDGEVENPIEEPSSIDNKVSEVEDDNVPIVDVNPQETHTDKRLIEEVERELSGLELESNRSVHEGKPRNEGTLSDGKAVGDQYSLVQEMRSEILEVEVDNSPEVSVKDQKEDHLDSSLADGGGDENDDDDNDDDEDDDNEDIPSDSGSDGAESSSPDASMADIMPMLDELHPLLPREAPQPRHMSHDESDAVSEQSHRSNDESGESDEDSEVQGEVEEDGAYYNEDEEEEAQGGKEDESKSAIKWTEDDQKNLMDLGTSELERNQRLENLIARRRARKSFRMMAEKNLIDFESADLPFNVPPISTARRNPFDLPYDSYDNMGLPPIPGSAPSVLLPRRNPFDIPYEANEEKPDLKGDGFEREFTTLPPQKDIFFRRHESFSLGPSSLGFVKQDKQEMKWRPVFMPERLASEGTSYSSFTRQSSEVSDSKLSSVPDSESVSSGADPDDKTLGEQDFSKEKEMISNLYQASNLVERGGQSSEDVASSETVPTEKQEHVEFEITLGEVENHREMEMQNHKETEVENKSETESSLSETEEEVNGMELTASEIHLETEPVEEESSSGSSLSSLSEEVDEKITFVKKDDGSSSLEASGNRINESVDPLQLSFEDSKLQPMGEVVDENQHAEPVYDSSPQAAGKLLSLTAISSDAQTEILEMVKPPASEKRAVFVEDEESKVHLGESIEKDSSHHEEMNAASTSVHAVDGVASGSGEVIETDENDLRGGSSESSPTFDDQKRSLVPEPAFDDVDSSPSLSGIRSIEEGKRNQEESDLYDPYDVHSSSFDGEVSIAVWRDEDDNSVASGNRISPYKTTVAVQEEEQFVVEHSLVPDLSTSEAEVLKEQAVLQEETTHLYEDQVHSSCSSEKGSIEEETCKDGISHPEKDWIKSSGIHSEMQGGSTEDLSVPLVTTEGEQPSWELEQVNAVDPNLSPPQKDHVKEDLLNKETVLVEQGELSSSCSNENIDASLLQGSELNAASELEKELSWSDKAIVEPDFDDHSILHEPATVTAVSKEDSGTISDVHDSAEKILTNLSPGTSDYAPIPLETPEHKSTIGEIDIKTSILDKEDHSRVSEHLDLQQEAHLQEENFNEIDEIKDIDEGFLSELDTVGDFSVKEAVGKLLCDELIQQEAIAGSSNIGMMPDDSNLTQTNGVLPILEAKSIVDIDLAFKQLHEGVDVEEVILPSVVEDQSVKMQSKDPKETTSDLQVVEAKSLEDIHTALKQVSEVNVVELPVKDVSVAEENEVGSVREIDSSSKEKESGTDKLKHDIHETLDNPESSISRGRGKKSNTCKVKSGSSSSSSSSDSE